MLDYWYQINIETIRSTLTVALEQIGQNALATKIEDALQGILLSS